MLSDSLFPLMGQASNAFPSYTPAPQPQAQGGINGLLSNPALQMGLGILASNTTDNFGVNLGRGGMLGMRNLQQQQLVGQRQQQMEIMAKMREAQAKELERRGQAAAKQQAAIDQAIQEHPEMASQFALDPQGALDRLYPKPVAPHSTPIYTPDGAFAFDSRTQKLTPLINPNTNKQVMRANDSPVLQGKIAKEKAEANASYRINSNIDGLETTDAVLANTINGTPPKNMQISPQVQSQRDAGRSEILQAELASEQSKLNTATDPQAVQAHQRNIGLLEQELGIQGIKVPTKAEQAAETEAAKAEAKDLVSDKVMLKEMERSLPNLINVVSELSELGQKATYTTTGRAIDSVRRELGFDVGEGAVARKEYIAKVANEILPLLRQTFGAAFTEREGESLKATLGDPNASPKEKDAVLRAFIETKRSQIEGMKGTILPRNAEIPSQPNIRKYNPKTGKIE